MNKPDSTPVTPHDGADDNVPEHGNRRRAFLIWALMLGATSPDVVTERVLAEIEGDAATDEGAA